MRYTGFPSPAEQYSEKRLDLNALLIRHPAATIMVRVRGDVWQNSGIHSGDTLIVDRSLRPREGQFIVAGIEGELKIRRMGKRLNETIRNPGSESLADQDVQVIGVVTWVIHQPE